MFKKIMIVVFALVLLFTVTGCGTYTYSINFLRVGNQMEVFLNAGEMAELDFAELFEDYVSDVKKVEMVSYNKKVFTVRGNEIRGVGAGMSYAKATVYTENNGNISFTVNVYVVKPSEMKEIKSAQDLIDIGNDLKGKYILKNDIDLKDFDNWLPIAGYSQKGSPERYFEGMFANPDGFKIKNLTINSVANIPPEKSNFFGAGLFGAIAAAYIDGLILEDISIDTTAYSDNSSEKFRAGGISSISVRSIIRNCKVDGLVVSQESAGGLVGLSGGLIIGSAFKGVVENTSSDKFGGSGGIIGFGYDNIRIIDCTVEATINGKLYAGGIVGHWDGSSYDYEKGDYIKNCSFTGELNAQYMGEICGYVGYPS